MIQVDSEFTFLSDELRKYVIIIIIILFLMKSLVHWQLIFYFIFL